MEGGVKLEGRGLGLRLPLFPTSQVIDLELKIN